MGLLAGVKKLIKEVKSWTWHHIVVFTITFFLYALYHACRKAFSNIKHQMGKSITPMHPQTYPYDIWQQEHMFENLKDANVFLGELDTLFLITYGFGLYVSGVIGDRVNLRYFLVFGIIGSSLATFSFGYLSVIFDIHNKWYFRCLFFINGLFQSTGWPALVSIMGNWFSMSSMGLVFGIWTINSYLGNVIGALFVSFTIDFGYEYGMFLNSLLAFCGGIVVLFCLIPDPGDIGLTTTASEDLSDNVQNNSNVSGERPAVDIIDNPRPIKFYEAFLIPGVIPYALCYACLKMVLYSFLFWLPTYLSQGLNWNVKMSDNLSNFFDVGCMIGSILAGIASDFTVFRAPIVSFSLMMSIGMVYMYEAFGAVYSANVLLMVLVGCTLGGPDCLVTTLICADLRNHDKIAGNTKALATVTGIVTGTGALGAALGQFVVGIISKYYGWQWVFKFLVIMVSMSFILILPIVIKEIKAWRKMRVNCSHEDAHISL